MSDSAEQPTMRNKNIQQGKKTHEQQLRTLERKPHVPDARRMQAELQRPAQEDKAHPVKHKARDSEFPVSHGGMNQESDHHKHNDPGQAGHKPQKHSPAE